MNQRPQDFRFNPQASLAKGLVFAGLGRHPKSKRYTDSSLYKNTGTLTNMDPASDWVWSEGLGRWALDFDGSDDYVLISASDALKPATAVSFGAWCKTTSSNYGFAPLTWDGGSIDAYSIHQVRAVAYSLDTQVSVRTSDGTTYLSYDRSEDTWTHVAGVFNSGWFGLYVDGVLRDSTSGLDSTLVYPGFGAQSVLLGTHNLVNSFWQGQLADPFVYSRALSHAEIQALADPSNVMLSGLLLPPRRRVWAVGSAGPTFNPAWARNCNNLIGAGI